jgi:5-methyltetrahydrofolate--homocysteine methyltransferase
MVPARTILDTAVEENADVVGLSGLITPSLDEMIGVAKEMTRREMQVPLLIGGATTSSKHTAVKIAPVYPGITLHVRDASLAASVVGKLLSDELRKILAADNAAAQAELRRKHEATNARRVILPIETARARRTEVSFAAGDVATPAFTGLRDVEPSLDELVPWIDWSPFFHAWELKGTYPAILDDATIGERARELLDDGRRLLDRMVSEKLVRARGVYGFFPAASDGDDIVVLTDDRAHERERLFFLRQQNDKTPCFCLADFVAPKGGAADHIGAFAVQAGEGLDELVARFEADHDDYNAILAKALADRLAEAFAEMLHKRARDDWGYGADEELDLTAILREKYRGIRPAFGYPACPDHSEKTTLFRLIEAEQRTGLELTEGMAMVPTAAVSGIYLANPAARYFSVGKLGLDQVEDYARRKGISVGEAERWLASNLGY